MGYFVRQLTPIHYKKTDESIILRRFKELNKHNELKSGGSFGRNREQKYWFSWMPESFEGLTTKDIFIELGFKYKEFKTGKVSLTGYDSKTGQ